MKYEELTQEQVNERIEIAFRNCEHAIFEIPSNLEKKKALLDMLRKFGHYRIKEDGNHYRVMDHPKGFDD